MVNPAYEVVARVPDPELPVVTIAELGILRRVDTSGDRAVVTVTPTYSGCPAMDLIRQQIAAALRGAGWPEVEVVTRLDPPWSTDQISDSGRAKLAAAGIAPPPPAGSGRGLPVLPPATAAACPRCGSPRVEEVSRFGSTPCTAVWRCRACAEPFPRVKAR